MYASTLRSALCLSGGGIRSATFNLGILQGLARHGLLEKFDYLSTVSGGGFIGSWLTAWIHRQGTQKVVDALSRPPASPLQPDPKPVEHLRVFSNYLSPQPGLLSADTWTLVATMSRNLLLTWLVFVPFLMAVLLVPRMWSAFIMRQTFVDDVALTLSLLIGFVTGGWALVYIGTSLPSAVRGTDAYDVDPREGAQRRVLVWCILPMVMSAMAFAVYWARLNDPPHPREWYWFPAFTILITLGAWLVSAIYRYKHGWFAGRWFPLRLFAATLFIVLAQFVTGYLLWYGATEFLSDPTPHKRLYTTFAVPMILLVQATGCALIAGFSSRFTKDEDREWWARSGAWALIVILAWIVVHLLVLFGPSGLEMFAATARGLWANGGLSWNDLTPEKITQVGGVVVGVVSGVITLFGGFSAETPANDKEAQELGTTAKLLGVLTSLLAPIFLAFVIILLALVTNWVLTSSAGVWVSDLLNLEMSPVVSSPSARWPLDHEFLIINTPLRYLVAIFLFLMAVSLLMGSLINTNAFSLHFMWRTRIIRAYLGASRRRRNPNPFTGFDTFDNIRMSELRPQLLDEKALPTVERPRNGDPPRPAPPEVPQPRKLFHVINIALNLAGGDKLAWQDRKAEPFTVSPLHAGSYWLGYRRSYRYGSLGEGISLGTAIAMSGAFVSPNMGYMMTSPIVRFLMTLFNVRFGWWLGNPGAAGDELDPLQRIIKWLSSTKIARGRIVNWILGGKIYREAYPFEYRSPLLPVRPIVTEAFGLTNDRSRYVYLSDGGHFENLGLHEMVLRRCRFIVVSDASTDASYTFDSLAQSIRQIRVDLGVPIDIRELSIAPPSKDMKGKYCAIGRIRYSCVDKKAKPLEPPEPPPYDLDAPNFTIKREACKNPQFAERRKLYKMKRKLYKIEQALHESQRGMTNEDFDGILIYIKASMIGDEPRDVLNYGQGSRDFPQEVITDQWFSEAQFESYRALGSHIIDAICGDDRSKLNFAAFARKARAHNQLKFEVFKEQISYAAFAKQFEEEMQNSTPDAYKQKIRKYLEDLLG
ncbi:MAG: patatin-like phospholipase family protein [Pyrinomonadaceae bacterium]|nr:patatin-like phospholipase family protein [Pyrinomonadaceae bacterium]